MQLVYAMHMDTVIFISYQVKIEVIVPLPKEILKGFKLNGLHESYQIGCSFLLVFDNHGHRSCISFVETVETDRLIHGLMPSNLKKNTLPFTWYA